MGLWTADRALRGLSHPLVRRLAVRLLRRLFRPAVTSAAGREMTTFTALLIGDPDDPRRARLEAALRNRTRGPLETSGETLSVCDQMAVPTPLPEKGCVAVVFCRKPM